MKPLERNVVHLYGDGVTDTNAETISGPKIFNNLITFNTPIMGTIDGSVSNVVTIDQVTGLSDILGVTSIALADMVHLDSSETITGQKTFTTLITGSISGTASSITGSIIQSQVTGLTSALNGFTTALGLKADANTAVSILGSYADPIWITSLNPTKVLPNYTGNIGNFLTISTDNIAVWGGIDAAFTTCFGLKTTDNLTEGVFNKYMHLAGNGSATTASHSDHTHVVANITDFPSQGNYAGFYLSTNGSTLSWATLSVLPNQSSFTSGQVLQSLSGNATWVSISAANQPCLLPSSFGHSGQYLSTDNSGVLSWASTTTLPDQTSNAGMFLYTNGSNTSWALALPAQGSNSGKYLTTDGGTAYWQFVDALPPQAGMDGRFLTTSSGVASWSPLAGLPSISGNAGMILTNNGNNAAWTNAVVPPTPGLMIQSAGTWSSLIARGNINQTSPIFTVQDYTPTDQFYVNTDGNCHVNANDIFSRQFTFEGTTGRVQLNFGTNQLNLLQTGIGSDVARLCLAANSGIEIRGSRWGSSTPPAYVLGTTADPNLSIINDRDLVSLLIQGMSSSQTQDLQQWYSNGSLVANVTTAGALTATAFVGDGSGLTNLNANVALPPQTSYGGQYLTTDGTTASWGPISVLPPQSSGTTNQVLVSSGVAGANWTTLLPTVATGDIGSFLTTTDGSTITWGSILPTTAGNAGLVLTVTSGTYGLAWGSPFPTMTGNNGKFLTVSNGAAVWGTLGGLPTIQSGYAGMLLTTDGTNPNWSDLVTTSGITIAAESSTYTPLVLQAAASQSANIQEWVNSSGASRSAIDCDGFAFPLSINFALGLGTPMATGLDKTNWYVLLRDCKLVEAWIIAKTGPTTTNPLAVNIEYSNSSGTWYTPTGYYLWDNSTLTSQLNIAAGASQGSTYSFTGGAGGIGAPANYLYLPRGTRLRINVTSVGDTIAGQDVTVELLCLVRNLVATGIYPQ